MTKNGVKLWSEKSDYLLGLYASIGYSSTLAAGLLKRSPGAVRQRALILKVRFKSLGRRHSRLQKARYAIKPKVRFQNRKHTEG